VSTSLGEKLVTAVVEVEKFSAWIEEMVENL
jgi:hypothetical protein